MTNGFSWLDNYDINRERISSRIAKIPSDFKILLKTKNEPSLLRLWIEHHRKIVGDENIVIFDNGSTNPEVETIYYEYASRITISRYGGFVDMIHSRRAYPELYDALRASCRYYIFLDTDEQLVWTDGLRFSADASIVGSIIYDPAVIVYPGIWLHNILGYFNKFQVGVNPGALIGGLRWGKPILASHLQVADIMMHNMQVFEARKFSPLTAKFLVLHRNLVSPGQRIQSNLRKLASYGVIKSGEGVETVKLIQPEAVKNVTCLRYIEEINRLLDLPVNSKGDISQSLELCGDGSIEFNTDLQREIFSSFIRQPDASNAFD